MWNRTLPGPFLAKPEAGFLSALWRMSIPETYFT